MNACCDKWLLQLEARVPKEGKFVEVHQCPTCKTTHRVLFEYHLVAGAWTGAAVGVT